MEEEMMQGQQAPQMAEGNPEEMLREKVMQVAEEILAEWKETGKINGKRITDEKEAKRTAVGMALKMIEEEAAMAENQQMAQQAPQQAPQQMGGGMMG